MQKTSRSVRFTAYTLFVLLLIALVALATELYFRNTGGGRYARSHFVFDPDLIWRLKPKHQAKKFWGEDHFRFRFNRQGFRGPDWNLAPKDGQSRLMILGDSYTAGLDVRYKDLYTSLLDQSFTQVEILNAGTPAWGTDQEYLFWEKIGKQYQPDYLLLMVAPNDVREAYVKGIIKREEGGHLTPVPVQMPDNARNGWWWASRFSTFQYIQRDHWDTRYGHFWDIYKHYPVNFGKEDQDNWDLPIFLKAPFAEAKAAQVLFQDLVRSLHQSTEEQGCQLILSIIPTKMEFDSTLADTSQYQPGLVADLLAEVAKEEDIPYLNLYEELRLSEDPMALFLSWDFHMNEVGNRYLADQLEPFLRPIIDQTEAK